MRISHIDDLGGASAAEVLDADRLLVLPGIVDTHVHLDEPGRTEWEGFETGTRAAAAGGVTTLLDMPLNSIPATTKRTALEKKRLAAQGQCHVDVGFLGGVVPGNADDVEDLWSAGVFAFKAFLVPSGVDEFRHVTVPDLRRALPVLAQLRATLMVHAELPELIDAATAEIETAGRDRRQYSAYLASRPPRAETQAVQLMIDLARRYNVHVHVVHVSSAETIALLRAAKAERLLVTAETCPHYLSLAAEEIRDGATEFKCAPPIRSSRDRDALWSALGEGVLDCVVSDHSPCTPALKCQDSGDFFAAWGGIASLELTQSVMNTALRARALPLQRLAAWMSAGPARVVGLHRAKGQLAPGLHADFALVDADATFSVDPSRLHQRHGVTPYAHRRLQGRVQATYLRGELIYEEGDFIGEARGRLLTRDRVH